MLPSADTTIAQRLGKLGFTRVTDLARTDGPSLRNAVVQLSTGCTGSFISRNGLVLTNYHCVSNALQQHSNATRNLCADGFYAETQADELPLQGMAVTITTGMFDVTAAVRKGIKASAPHAESQAQIASNITHIIDSAARQSGASARIVQQFAGNRYLLITQMVFRDVRLVLIPPANIGKFGGDTDNWTYPRHTGDFSLLRVYAGQDNAPADYSAQNQPYKAASLLTISQNGYAEGDLSVTLGYPGTTQRYATAGEIEFNRDYAQKAYTDVWERLIPLWDTLAAHRPNYAAANISNRMASANYLKYYQMQREAIDLHGLIAQREDAANDFCAWYAAEPARKDEYFGVISDLNASLNASRELKYQYILLNESLRRGMPLMGIAARFSTLASALKAKDRTATEEFKAQLNDTNLNRMYEKLDLECDRATTAASLGLCLEKLPREALPDALQAINGAQELNGLLDQGYANSFFTSKEGLKAFLAHPSLKKLKTDPLYQLALSITTRRDALRKQLEGASRQFHDAQQRYLKGLLAQHADSSLYPDADGTLRLSYGRVKSLNAADGVHLNYFTTLAGMAQKAASRKPEYEMNSLLAKLQKHGAFSGYQNEDGQMPLNFITTNDITGGNSGSPVINQDGELIGLAFDCNSEGVIGQYTFDGANARCICVDIRFVILYVKLQKNLRVFNELPIFAKSPRG